jgi:hypothetical protein
MPCGACGGRGTLDAPRTIEKPLTAAEIQARMPRKPVAREESPVNGSPRRTR